MAQATFWIILGSLLALAGLGVFWMRQPPAYSNVKADETIAFFRTSAWRDAETGNWNVPIHGWVYQPQDSHVRRAVFERILDIRYGLVSTPQTEANLARRLNLLIADNERGKRIVIDIAGRTEVLPTSGPNGHFSTTLTFAETDLAPFLEGDVLSFRAVMAERDNRVFGGDITFIPPRGPAVLSDIDDTVKATSVTDRQQLLQRSFFDDFEDVPGMAELYGRWAACGASFHFVSSSPWQFYAPLREFLDEAGFPWATLNLKLLRFRDDTLLDLLKEGTETKPPVIREILDRYRGRSFVLVGDTGEQDPEVYAEILRERPSQIRHVYLRNITGEAVGNTRMTTAFREIELSKWTLFERPDSIGIEAICDADPR